MLFSPGTFRNSALEEQYQAETKDRLARSDNMDIWPALSPLRNEVRSAALFAALWAVEVWRFLSVEPLGLVKATVWLVAVGMKPVYVYWMVGKPFYLEWRAWIITFTKVVFAIQPPGERLHLQALHGIPGGGGATPSMLRALWLLACGVRLPYMLVTGLGWQDFFYNVPVQLALVGRAIKDNEAQCAAPFFRAPQVQGVLRGLADRLTATLATALRMGAGLNGHQVSFPSNLDPCILLGSWGVLCCGFLLTTLVLATAERRARAEFARRHSDQLAAGEREEWMEGAGSSSWVWAAAALLFVYACLLGWQALISLYSWASPSSAGL